MPASQARVRLTIDGKDVKNSFIDLSSTARALRKDIKDLEVGGDEWVKKSQDLKKVEGRLTDVKKEVKEAGKEYGQLRKSWVRGTNEMVNSVNVFGVNVGQMRGQFGLFNKTIAGTNKVLRLFKIALVSTGIGAILVLLGSLITFLSRTQKGVEIVRKATTALSAAFDVIIDRISMFGQGLYEIIIERDFSAGINKLKNSFKGVGDEIQREVRLAYDLQESLIALEKAETDFTLTRARRKRQIQELIFLTRDETASFAERREALIQANELEKQNLADALSLQRERVRIAQEEYDRAESIEKDRKALIEEKVKLEELEAQSLSRQRELRNRMNELNNKEKASLKGLLEEKEYQLELERRISDFTETEIANRQTIQIDGLNAIKKINIDYAKDMETLNERLNEKRKKQDEEYYQTRKNAELEAVNISGQAFSTFAGFLRSDQKLKKESAGLQKAFSVGQIWTNLWQEISGYFAHPASIGSLGIVGGLKAGLATARAGLATQRVLSQKFFRGGHTGSGYGVPDESGYRQAGIVHEGEYVAPKWLVNDASAKPAIDYLENRRLRGYAAGGVVTSPTDFNVNVNDQGLGVAADKMVAAAKRMEHMQVRSYISYDDLQNSQNEVNGIIDDSTI